MFRYILISLKKKLPLFIISLVLFANNAFIIALNVNFLEEINSYGYMYNKPSTGLAFYLVVFMLFMFFLPIASMNYRYSLAKSDLFRQAPYKKNTLRYVEHLTTLGIIILAFTIGFFFMMFATMILNYNAKLPEEVINVEYRLIHFNYGYYVLAYLFLITMGVIQYFISYLFISRSNNVINSLIMLFLGEFVLLFMFFMPVRFFFNYNRLYNSSLALPVIAYLEIFEGLIIYGKPSQTLTFDGFSKETLGSLLYLLQYIAYALVGILGLVAFIIEKDPSGEYAGKAKTNRPYQDIIFHLGAFVFGSMICGLEQSLLYFLVTYVFFLAGYYTFFGLLNRNFVPKLKDIILLVSIALLVLLYSFSLFLHEAIVLGSNYSWQNAIL